MASTLRIELDEPGPSFPARHPLRGRVIAEVDRRCICDKLVVVLGTTTESIRRGGDSDQLTLELYTGAWDPGTHEVPFEIPLRGYPPTYRGHLFQLAWHLSARMTLWDGTYAGTKVADVEAARIPLDVHLPADGGVAAWPRIQGDPARVNERSSGSLGLLAALSIGLTGLTGYGVASGQWPVTLGGGVGLLLVLALLILAWRQYRLTGVTGTIQLRIHTADAGGYRAQAHDRHIATVWAKPDAPIDRVTVQVVVYEQVESGSRAHDNYEVHRHPLWSDARALERTAPGTWTGELPLPPAREVPFTLGAGWSNKVLWKATVEVTLSDGTTDTTEVALTAYPARGPGAEPDKTAALAAAAPG